MVLNNAAGVAFAALAGDGTAMLVELREISKRFAGVAAVDGVSISLERGQVHGVLGENGAGKTTIMKILYGMVRADGGSIVVDGKRVEIGSPRAAIGLGIGMVHQHFMLAPAMTVLDNVLLGDVRQGQLLDRRGAATRLARLGEEVGLAVDPWARVEALSVGQQQRVEILKALWRQARVLILDEPTAVLTPMETDQLLGAMGRLKEQGKAVVFISHKLREVRSVCDQVTILRRGKVVWRGGGKVESEEELARLMVGEGGLGVWDLGSGPKPESRNPQPMLVLDGVTAQGISNISLELGTEILGIAGVDGNGQQELAEVIVGLRKVLGGRVIMEGRDVTGESVLERMKRGVAHVPNDRKAEGLVLGMGVGENLVVKHHRENGLSCLGVMRWGKVREMAGNLAGEFDVRTSSIDAPVGTLSGGNQQKVVLARELAVKRPRVIVAMNPTRGLDVGASEFVYGELAKRREEGRGVVLISSELDDLLRVADRIGVLYRGRLVMTAFPEEGAERIGRLMAGVGEGQMADEH
jgi:ABC-type uncharacterized transport system ATPase subunit